MIYHEQQCLETEELLLRQIFYQCGYDININSDTQTQVKNSVHQKPFFRFGTRYLNPEYSVEVPYVSNIPDKVPNIIESTVTANIENNSNNIDHHNNVDDTNENNHEIIVYYEMLKLDIY